MGLRRVVSGGSNAARAGKNFRCRHRAGARGLRRCSAASGPRRIWRFHLDGRAASRERVVSGRWAIPASRRGDIMGVWRHFTARRQPTPRLNSRNAKARRALPSPSCPPDRRIFRRRLNTSRIQMASLPIRSNIFLMKT